MELTEKLTEEFESRTLDYIKDGIINEENQDEWHFYLFNQDYYITGYYNAEQWLKKHDISPFQAIGECMEYENENFGEVYKIYDNAETTVNMLTYVLGEQWINGEGEEFILNELKQNAEV